MTGAVFLFGITVGAVVSLAPIVSPLVDGAPRGDDQNARHTICAVTNFGPGLSEIGMLESATAARHPQETVELWLR